MTLPAAPKQNGPGAAPPQAPAAAVSGERRRFPFPVGRPLAMRSEDVDFSWVYSVAKPNTRTDAGVEIVTIDGPLEHKSGWWFDSYEEILKRVEGAMTGSAQRNMDACRHYGEEAYHPLALTPALAVVLRINSPGGEAAGATAAHKKLRALSAQYACPLYAYADELAASAAYEIASAAQEIWLPESGVVGSIGVIATAYDRTRQNDMVGLAIELITSGAFKADGHPDRPLDDGIRGRIQARVNELAGIFFQVVADARGTNVRAIADLQAATFLGYEAVSEGVADGVADWDAFLELVTKSVSDGEVPAAEVNVQGLTAAPAAA